MLAFQTGPDIASAYGIAVTGTMLITTMLVLTLAVRGWKWPWTLVVPLFLLLLVVDGALFSANMLKFVEGGWVPLAIATMLFIAMWTWYRGRHAVGLRERERTVPIDTLLATIEPERLHRTQGTAIYLTTFSDGASSSLMQNLRHNGVLHEHVVLLTVHLLDEPFVSPEDRLRVRELGSGLHPRGAVLRLHGEARRRPRHRGPGRPGHPDRSAAHVVLHRPQQRRERPASIAAELAAPPVPDAEPLCRELHRLPRPARQPDRRAGEQDRGLVSRLPDARASSRAHEAREDARGPEDL